MKLCIMNMRFNPFLETPYRMIVSLSQEFSHADFGQCEEMMCGRGGATAIIINDAIAKN